MKQTYGMWMLPYRLWMLPLMLCWACGGTEQVEESPTTPEGVRGDRYCEVLLAYPEGSNVRIDVYNTYGLNECPAEQWEHLDAQQLRQEYQAAAAILNGPRHWVIDAFANSNFLEQGKATFGGIEMRKAGQLRVPPSQLSNSGASYATQSITRNTTYVFDAGKRVHELVNPSGQIFVMQSFSLQRANLSEEALPSLGQQLSVPEGWTYRTRELSQELRVTAIDGVATVVQDELGNTYQLSQQ